MPETVGVEFLLKADSNVIGGRDDATLSLSRESSELAPTAATGATYARSLAGLKDWSVDYDALYLENSEAISGFSPTVTVNPSGTGATLERISEVSLTIERDAIEFANSSHSQYVARRPSVIRMEAEITTDVDAEAQYATGNASRLLFDAWDSTSGRVTLEIALPGGNTSFQADFIVSEIEFTGPTDDASEATFSLTSDGVITETIGASVGTGLNAIITNIFADDPSALSLDFTTEDTGSIQFSGTAWPSSTEVTIPVEGAEDGVTVSGTLSAADALTIEETA